MWTHPEEHRRLSNIYHHMKRRCFNKKNIAYHNYGGRGITICQEWLGSKGFHNFKTWARNNGYNDKLIIDRINNDGNYEPSNCRWVTLKYQQHNKRTNVFIQDNGEQLTVMQYAEKYNLKSDRIYHRLKKGWSLEDALHKPVRSYKGDNK